ncbi:MAG: hypothetical protein MRZ37_03600 [Tenericutes bacterium]|nr:hypothetical protein [Mycoplasmatota bacterium]
MKKILKKILAYTLIFCELFQATGVYALTKEENVYAKLNESGDVKSVSFSEHLYDYNGNKINDKSNLKDIKNINGNEKFTQNGENLLWETNGDNIYYKGTYEKDLPISVNVKYYLDGEEKNVNDILGKKGNIKIVLNYKNNSYKNMNINGKTEKIYVPYAIVTTTILNNTDNKNIKVTNGKVIDNGVSSVITAISSPGLYESLKLDDLKNINKVEITYDTESFELNSIYSVATTSLFDDNGLEMFSEVNNLYKSISLLQSNMDTIVDASKKLSDGSSQMNAGITELNTKIQELIKKYQYYRNQDRNALKEELIKIVEENINKITPALEEEITTETSKLIKENKEELENAVITYTKKNTTEVIDEEVTKIVSELDIEKLIEKTINSNLYNLLKNDSEVIELSNMLKKDINEKLTNIVTNEFNNISSSLGNNMSDVQNKDIDFIVENYGLTEEQAKEIVNKVQNDTLEQVNMNIKSASIPERIISAVNDENYVSNLVKKYIQELNIKLNESLNKDTTITEYSKELKDKIISAIKKDLEEGNLYLNKDVKTYISELVDKIIDNTAKDLSNKYTEDYTNKVVKNIIEKQFSEENVDSKLRELLDMYEDDINQKVTILDDTINTLSDSLNQLNNSSNQISNGMKALSAGLDKYNKEGINKINNLVNGNVKSLQKRLDAIIELSNKNKMIDNYPSNSSNSSKIIFMIDSVSNPENNIVTVKKEETKSSFLDKIKGLFK